MGAKAISVRVETDNINDLDKLAKELNRDRSFVINEAIETYLDIHRWQIDRIKSAIKQADQGEFADEKYLQRVLKKWQG